MAHRALARDPAARAARAGRAFLPRGLLGLAYWYAVLPVHGYVLGRMLAGIRRAAERMAADDVRRDLNPTPLSAPPITAEEVWVSWRGMTIAIDRGGRCRRRG